MRNHLLTVVLLLAAAALVVAGSAGCVLLLGAGVASEVMFWTRRARQRALARAQNPI
jgi:hypothetical protein